MKKLDSHWLRQCRLGKYIDPVQYAVPAKFLGRKEDVVVPIDDSTHSEQSTNSLVEQINHHRNSIHSLDPIDVAGALAPNAQGASKPCPEEFENWNEESLSNERYSEYLSKNRTKSIMSSRNTVMCRFQSYDELVENEAVVEIEDPSEVSAEAEKSRQRKESDQVDLEGDIDVKLPESLKTTDSEEYSQNIPPPEQSLDVSGGRSKSGDRAMTPPVKTRSHRSPSTEKNEKKRSASSSGTGGRRRSGSSRFKKDAYCDSLLAAVTLRSLEGRLEKILSTEISLAQKSHGDSVINPEHIPYAFASRVMGLIEIAVTPRV